MSLNRFEQILYINLSHRTDRKERLLEELNKMGVDQSRVTRIDAHYDPLHGHRGCAISHHKAITHAIECGYQNVLILEDDFVFTVDKEAAEAYLDLLSPIPLWDVLFLGANVIEFEPTQYKDVLHVTNAQTAHSYVVNRHYYKMIQDCFQAAIEKLSREHFFFESSENLTAIDAQWKVLQRVGKWYMGRHTIGHQGPSYSDILQDDIVRHTPLKY